MSYKTGFYEGRLGIGLSSTMGMGDGNPRYPLDINGDIRLTGSIVNGNGQVLSLVPQESLWTIGTTDITYTGGNVGIGTTSPDSLFHIFTNENRGATNTTNKTMLTIESATSHDCTVNNFNPISIDFVMGDNNAPKGVARIGSLMCPTGSAHDTLQGEAATALTFSTQNNVSGAIPEERMRITYNGNVGIGTTDPKDKLHVKDGNIIIDKEWGYICWGNDTNTMAAVRAGTLNGIKVVQIMQAGAPTMTIKSSNVGIGTTSPFGKLDIKHSNWTQTPSASTMGDMLNLMVSSPSTTGENNMRTLLCFADGYRNDSATKDSYRVRCRMSGAGFDMIWNSSATETIGANTTNNNFIFARDYTAFMNKNVGIGTTSPGYKLHIVNPTLNNSIQDLLCLETHVNSQTAIGPGLLFRERWNNGSYFNLARILGMEQSGYGGQLSFWTNNGAGSADDTLLERMRIDENGKVGIGTTSPAFKMDMRGSGDVDLNLTTTNTSGGWAAARFGYSGAVGEGPLLYVGAQQGQTFINSRVDYPIIFKQNDSEVFRVESNSEIGMYNTAPTPTTVGSGKYGKLYVQGGHNGTQPTSSDQAKGGALVIGCDSTAASWNTNRYGGFLVFTQPYWSGQSNDQIPGGWISCKKAQSNGSFGWGMAFGTTNAHGADYDEKMLLTQTGWLSIDGTYQSSDDRIKHNETIIENALETLNQLEGKVYFKTHKMYEPNHDFNLDISGEPIDESGNLIDYTMESGFIAQSVLKIDKLKHLVTGGDEYVEETTIKRDLSGNPILDNSGNTIIDEVKTVLHKKKHILNYCGLIPWNTEGIKELYKENLELKTKVSTLESELAAIKQHLGI